METAYKIFDNFSTLCGVGVIVIDKNGQILYASEEYKRHIEAENALEKVFCNADQCQVSMVYGSYQAQRFGGRYIFFCPKGLIHCASPLVKNGEMYASVIAGPLLMTDYEEYLEVDVKGKFSLSPEILQELGEKIRLIPFISPERVQAMSEQLFVNVSYICGETQKALGYEQEQKRLQAAISEYIIKMKPASDSGWYPLSTEDQLLQSMSSGDKFAAKGLLNELLSHIFFHAGSDMETIRSRVLELTVLLSRAAVKGGADAEMIFGLNYTYLHEIESLKSVEEVTFWLHDILNKFTEFVFNFNDVKHVDVIHKAISYMKSNYMRKITLEEVANSVYLSPSYLSTVFKNETGSAFNSYLNKLRIEESKKLLRNQRIPLSDISNMVGYEDQSYFTRVFKKMTGISPGKYRQSHERL